MIPLSAGASRGDQILNAASFEKQGFSMVLKEEVMTAATLTDAAETLYADRDRYIDAMTASGQMDSIEIIMKLIREVAK